MTDPSDHPPIDYARTLATLVALLDQNRQLTDQRDELVDTCARHTVENDRKRALIGDLEHRCQELARHLDDARHDRDQHQARIADLVNTIDTLRAEPRFSPDTIRTLEQAVIDAEVERNAAIEARMNANRLALTNRREALAATRERDVALNEQRVERDRLTAAHAEAVDLLNGAHTEALDLLRRQNERLQARVHELEAELRSSVRGTFGPGTGTPAHLSLIDEPRGVTMAELDYRGDCAGTDFVEHAALDELTFDVHTGGIATAVRWDWPDGTWIITGLPADEILGPGGRLTVPAGTPLRFLNGSDIATPGADVTPGRA